MSTAKACVYIRAGIDAQCDLGAARLRARSGGVRVPNRPMLQDSCQRTAGAVTRRYSHREQRAVAGQSMPHGCGTGPCHSARPSRLLYARKHPIVVRQPVPRSGRLCPFSPYNAGSGCCWRRSQHVCRAVGDQPAIFRFADKGVVCVVAVRNPRNSAIHSAGCCDGKPRRPRWHERAV